MLCSLNTETSSLGDVVRTMHGKPTPLKELASCAGLMAVSLAMVFGAGVISPPTAVGAVVDIDRIVVVVNDDVITNTELNARIANVKRELAVRNIRPPSEPVLKKQVLERMVLERVQLQLASGSGVRVNEAEVDRAIKKIAERNQVTPEVLYRAVRREGIGVETYRSQIRDRVTIQRLVEREVNNRITVSDTEVDSFLARRRGEVRANDSYNISLILIGVPDSATPVQIQAARFKARQIHRALKEGGSFEELAIANSQGQNALQGGAIGWKKPGQLPGIFLAALKDMQPGDTSDIIRSPVGFHILRLNDHRSNVGGRAVTQTHVRHILIQPNEVRSIAEVREKLLKLRERVVNGEDFGDLARAHSEDTASAAKGGDLGWILPGRTVPEFEKQMNLLEPNGVSEPVETPFGLHLIQVLEWRQHDVSEERDRAAARQQIHARKADERYDQWLRQLRAEAFVEYRLQDTY